MSLPRILTSVILTGSKIFLKAFIEAYTVASQNAAKTATTQTVAAATRTTGMSVQEAQDILNVKQFDKDSIMEKYDFLFKQNDVKNGGSFYLQSKIVRARERLELEMNEMKVN